MQNLGGMGWMEIPLNFDALEEEEISQVPVFNFNTIVDAPNQNDNHSTEPRVVTQEPTVDDFTSPVTPSSDGYPQTPFSEIPDFQDECRKGGDEEFDDGSLSEFDFSMFQPINQRTSSFSEESFCPSSTPCHSRPSLEGMSTDIEDDETSYSYMQHSESCSSVEPAYTYTGMQLNNNMNDDFLTDERRSTVDSLSSNVDPSAQPSVAELEEQMETLKRIIKKRKAEEQGHQSNSTRRARSTEPRSKRWRSSSSVSSTASSTSPAPPSSRNNNNNNIPPPTYEDSLNNNMTDTTSQNPHHSRRSRHQSLPQSGLHPASIVLGSLIPTLERQLQDFNPISPPYPGGAYSNFTTQGNFEQQQQQQYYDGSNNSFFQPQADMTSEQPTQSATACPSTAADHTTEYILVPAGTSALQQNGDTGSGFLQELLTFEYGEKPQDAQTTSASLPDPTSMSQPVAVPEPILTPLAPVGQDPHFPSYVPQHTLPTPNAATFTQEAAPPPIDYPALSLPTNDLLESIALAATTCQLPQPATDCLNIHNSAPVLTSPSPAPVIAYPSPVVTTATSSPAPIIKQEVPETPPPPPPAPGTSHATPCSSTSSVDSEGRRSKQQLLAAAQQSVETGSLTPMVKQELKLTILNRRLAQGQTDIKDLFTPPVKYELTEEEKQKKQHKKNLNRIAAQNHRERKKAKVAAEEKEAEALTARREELQEVVDRLEHEKQWLLGKVKDLMPHVDINNYI